MEIGLLGILLFVIVFTALDPSSPGPAVSRAGRPGGVDRQN